MDFPALIEDTIKQEFIKNSKLLYLYIYRVVPIVLYNKLKYCKNGRIILLQLSQHEDQSYISDISHQSYSNIVSLYRSKSSLSNTYLKEKSIYFEISNVFWRDTLLFGYTTPQNNFTIHIADSNGNQILCSKISVESKKTVFFNKHIRKRHLEILETSVRALYLQCSFAYREV